jgi:hypothetical protein
MVYDPGYTREDTTVSVVTNVYVTSKPDSDLVWNKSFNPKSAKKVADALVKEVGLWYGKFRFTVIETKQ